MTKFHIKEGVARVFFIASAGISILAVALICVFLFANGLPAIAQIGLPDFLFGTTWKPGNDLPDPTAEFERRCEERDERFPNYRPPIPELLRLADLLEAEFTGDASVGGPPRLA